MKDNITSPLQYRPDIDGLRAIAVLLVVLYHAGFDIISGGYIGVDIFFVISGYLITKIIVRDIENDNFSFISFYERRIRRILPALYVVIFSCIIVFAFLFLPEDYKNFGKSIVASTLFLSNMLFWHEAGYFDSGADLKPLLHTWSLSVEEQFYIFFPIALILTYRFFRSFKILIISLGFITSLLLSIWATENAATANFYFLPTRAWELLMGSFLAVASLPQSNKRLLNETLSALGFVLIFYSSLTYSYATAFPGLSAVLPCLGATLIIYANTNHQTFIGNILKTKPLVMIGLMSYSLYLWHWPIILLCKYLSESTPTLINICFALALSFMASYFSWKYIETPFRKKTIFKSKKQIFSLTLISSIILIIIGSLIVIHSGFEERFENIDQLQTLKKKNYDQKCADIPAQKFDNNKCVFGPQSNKYNYIIWGDSHAQAMAPAIIESAERHGNLTGFLAANSGCPPLVNFQIAYSQDRQKCLSINQTVSEYISAGTTVFLVARWTYYLDKSPINQEGPVWSINEDNTSLSETNNHYNIENSLKETLDHLSQKQANIVLVGMVPEFPKDVPQLYWQFGKTSKIQKDQFDNRVHNFNSIIKALIKDYDIHYIEPHSVFCNTEICTSIEEENVYFRDNDHISPTGAKKISPLYDYIFKELK